MEFLRSFLRRHFAGKPVVESQNVRCLHRLRFQLLCFFVPLKRRANGSNNSQHCRELLRSFWQWCANGCDNSQQHATTCNKVCKRTQHVTFNNVWSCWPTMFRPFAWDFTQQGTIPLTVWNLLFTDGSLQVLNQNPNLKEMKERSACGLIQININRTWPRLCMDQRLVEFSLSAQCLQN